MQTATMEETETRTELIAKLRGFILQQGHRQRLAKRARRTKRTPQAERARLLRELRLVDDLASIQARVDRQRQWLTVAHVVYGDLRGRPHPVEDPDSYRKLDRFLFEQI